MATSYKKTPVDIYDQLRINNGYRLEPIIIDRINQINTANDRLRVINHNNMVEFNHVT